jgi:PAS domain S-box-containing protein
MRRTSAKWQPIWPLLAVLGALSAFGLGALVGMAGPSRVQVWARHEQVTGALDGVLFYLRDAEEAERDFLLTGRPGDLRRAGAAAAAARDASRRLRRQASEEREQQRRVERLDALLGHRLATLEGEIAQRRQAPPGRAWIRLSGRDQAELERIRQLAAEVRREERRVLQRRLERADAGRQVIAFISGGAGLLLFGLLPLAFWLTERNRRQLADAAQVLNQALEASAAAAWQWDVASRRLAWSEQASALLGVGADRLSTFDDFLALVHPDDAPGLRRALDEAVARGGEVRHEFRVRRPDGALRWLAGSGRFFRPSAHEPQRMAGTVMDITDRERAERSLRFLAEAGTLLAGSLDFDVTLGNVARLAVETIADFCFCDLLDEEGQVERVTWAHRDPERQRALEGAWRFLPPADVEHHPVARTLRTGRAELVPVVGEAWLRDAAPTEEHYRFLAELEPRSLITVPVGTEERPLGALTFCRAARGGRPYEAADLELAKELGRRAGVAVENARLYRSTQQANAAKDQFLATLSHELRTPLTPVLAVVSALEEDRRLPADVRQRLATVRRNAELEARLIDDLLDLTRIERGKLDLHREVTDVLPLLAHAVEACRTPESEEKALRLVTELAADDHRVWADGSRLSQVFWNLLKNAVKFTPEGGTIRVRSWNEGEAEAAERWLVVEVADTGIGIEPQLLPRIFDAFEQGQQTITRRYGGLGLGLAISRAIAELHGGTLEAASEGRDRGSTFTMRLPLGLPAHAVPWPPMGADFGEITLSVPVFRPLHVLLVEDHQDTAEAMADLLRASGHQVTVAGSVDEALAAAAAASGGEKDKPANGGAIDLVVSDLGLPDGSGYDLMRELAGRYGLRGIALSGYGMDEDVRQSREAGFERHLTKPVDLRTLEAAIRDSAPPLVS